MNIRIPCLSGTHFIRQKNNRQLFLLLMILLVNACTLPTAISERSASKADALVIAQDERIAMSGKKVLESGGNAADAMANMLLTSAVVVPSRSGLGAGGVCQILNPKIGRVETLDFTSVPMTFDKKIGTPSLPRGAYVLKNKYGTRPWKEAFTDAIELAKKGTFVAPELAQDILNTQGLSTDWKKLKSHDTFTQTKLAETLRLLAQNENVDLLYNGQIANSIVMQSDQIIQEDLKATKADISDSIDVVSNTGKTFFPNPTALSSAEGYMIWNNLQNQKNTEKNEQAQKQLTEIQNRVIDSKNSVTGMSFLTADDSGLVIACSVSMGNTFGSRQMTQEGFYLSTPVHPKNKGYVFLNIMQTNPDITDVTYALQGVGDTALSDGLTVISKKQLNATSQPEAHIPAEFIELTCDKGFPNYAQTCHKTDHLLKITKKQNLTK